MHKGRNVPVQPFQGEGIEYPEVKRLHPQDTYGNQPSSVQNTLQQCHPLKEPDQLV